MIIKLGRYYINTIYISSMMEGKSTSNRIITMITMLNGNELTVNMTPEEVMAEINKAENELAQLLTEEDIMGF